MTATRDLSDRLAHRILEANPFQGTWLGLREYDALLSDDSAAAEAQLGADLAAIDAEAAALEAEDDDDRITNLVIRSSCARYLAQLESHPLQYTVTAMPMAGPPALFAFAARTVLPDPEAADAYLSRLRGAGGWFDTVGDRLREGRAAGRLPVGSLVDEALDWADRTLADSLPEALVAPVPPDDWDGASAWRAEVETLITDSVMPALRRWRDVLADLRPYARSDDDAGLSALPGGAQTYARCIAVHTTLELSPQELHQIGLDRIAELEARAVELGATIGLDSLAEVIAAVRASADDLEPESAMASAREAIARAEARAHEIMPPPLPDPCAVEAMPPTVADSGMAPHYTRPREDTGRPGTFWFNTRRATAGAGWDLEAVAFHEAVPGHHSQLARQQRIEDMPLLRQLPVTVHAEGWGLYAERLADEFGLYSGARALIGAVYIEMHRAARLVVDTGLHALGWSRPQAVQFMLDHVALPEQFLRDEIDRYIAWPGQALAYMTGQREILRLREHAASELGERFDLPAFHAELLDHGSLPLPVLGDVVEAWVREVSRATR